MLVALEKLSVNNTCAQTKIYVFKEKVLSTCIRNAGYGPPPYEVPI